MRRWDNTRGCKDAGGTKIFEGDILEFTNDGECWYAEVVFEDGAFLLNEGDILATDLLPTYDCLAPMVVGNIYDTPLLVGKIYDIHELLEQN